jgi:Ca2+-binding EF-hand superfamily protein
MNPVYCASIAIAALVALPLAVPRTPNVGAAGPAQGRGGSADPGQVAPKSPVSNEDLAATYFATCDYDGDGWISYSEAQKSLNVDRTGFAVFDVDRDGRITAEEFRKRYDTIVARGGAFAPPIAKADARRIPKRTAEELLDAFDRNKDLGLDTAEMETALGEYGAHGVDAKMILQKLDKDLSTKLEVTELPEFLEMLMPTPAHAKKKVKSIAELFDKVEPRELRTDATPQPAHILGPVNTFRRLDMNNSGGISVQDLIDLQRPMQLSVRTNAVIATLDTNGDGEVSEAEFRAALR